MRIELCQIFLVTSVMIVKIVGSQKAKLPQNIKPERYELDIFTDMDTVPPSFWGEVRIFIKCFENTQKIILHTKEEKIIKNFVSVNQIFPNRIGEVIKVIDRKYELADDFFIIELEKDLETGNTYKITVPFERVQMSIVPKGYFIIKLEEEEGEFISLMTTTELSPDGARSIFPCLDELHMKASFKIYLGHDPSFSTYSNMDITVGGTNPDPLIGGWVIDEYEESPAISPSALVMGLIKFKKSGFPNQEASVYFRLWMEENIFFESQLPDEEIIAIFKFFTDYFRVPHASKKFDFVVLPVLNYESREKYGLISLAESNILLNSDNPSANLIKANVIYNLCRTISRQWLGAQTTMSSWNEIWLHDALALVLEEPCFAEVFVEDNLAYLNSITTVTFNQILVWDALMSPPPVWEQEEESKYDTKLPDTFKTRKAFFLIRMAKFFLGDEVFKKSLTKYLTDYRFKNSNLDEVWDIFTNLARIEGDILDGMTMKQIMEPWIKNMRFPLVTIIRCDESKSLTIKQEPFPEYNDDSHNDETWHIPLSFMTIKKSHSENMDIVQWLKVKEITIPVDNLNDEDLILFNLHLNVFCRTMYDEKNWKLLQKILLDKNSYRMIDELTQFSLISDMFALSRLGKLKYEMLFEIMQYLSFEERHIPWTAAADGFLRIRLGFFGTEFLEPFQNYVKEILSPVFAKEEIRIINEIPSNSIEGRFFKILVVTSSCTYGVKDCVDQSQHLFKKWIRNDLDDENSDDENPDDENPDDETQIPAEIRPIVFCSSIKSGGTEDWLLLKEKYLEEDNAKKKKEILSALGCSRDQGVLKDHLEWSISGDNPSKSDSILAFKSMYENDVAYPVMRNFFIDYFQNIVEYHENKSYSIFSYLQILFECTTKTEDKDLLHSFMISNVNNHLNDQDKARLELSISTATRNIQWLQIYKVDFSMVFGGVSQ